MKFGRSLEFTEAQFHHLKNGDNAHLLELQGLTEMMYGKFLIRIVRFRKI